MVELNPGKKGLVVCFFLSWSCDVVNSTFKVFWILSYLQLYRALQMAGTGYLHRAANMISPYPLLNRETDAPSFP